MIVRYTFFLIFPWNYPYKTPLEKWMNWDPYINRMKNRAALRVIRIHMHAGVKRILFLLLVKFRKKYARARVFIGIICMARRFHQEKIVFDAWLLTTAFFTCSQGVRHTFLKIKFTSSRLDSFHIRFNYQSAYSYTKRI